MAQCKGTTKKGEQCRRDAPAGAGFCAIHADQELRERTHREPGEWDRDAMVKAAIGFGLVGLIFLLRFRR